MPSTQYTYNILRHFTLLPLLDENTYMRLYSNIHHNMRTPVETTDSLMSVCSANEQGHSCRICRWHRNDLTIQECPCDCKGSVGYVHMKCLRRWIIHRGNTNCEICGTRFKIAQQERNYKRLFWSFFQSKYLGNILKNTIHLFSVAPISYVILFQMIQLMDNLELEENNAMHIMVLAPAILLTSSLIFFHIFEFSLTRIILIKNVLKHWWDFGEQDSEAGSDMDLSPNFMDFFY